MTEIQEGSKVAHETDPRALASMASFGLLLNEAEVCLLADFTCDLLGAASDALSWWENYGLFNPDDDAYLTTLDALRRALSSEDATRPTTESKTSEGGGNREHLSSAKAAAAPDPEKRDATRPTGDGQ